MEIQKVNLENLPCSIKEFFKPEEYDKIPDYERRHLSNIRQNFEALRKYGKLFSLCCMIFDEKELNKQLFFFVTLLSCIDLYLVI